MINDRSSLDERLIGTKPAEKPAGYTTNQFIYLFWCYKRLKECKSELNSCCGGKDTAFAHCKNLMVNILRSLLTILDDTVDNGISIMSVKFVGLVKVVYLGDVDDALFEEFFDLFMRQFDKTDSEWPENGDALFSPIDDSVELNFFTHIFRHLNESVIEMKKCEDFSADYLKYIKIAKLFARSKLMKYLLIENSILGNEVISF